jgi:hypothetical protein
MEALDVVYLEGDQPVTPGSASDRPQQWEMAVRRSFGISDLDNNHDARETLIGCLEDELQMRGWESAPRAVAQPLVDSLMVLEVVGDLSDPTFTTRDRANRLVANGIGVIDPEHLVYDPRFEYPPEIVAAVQQMLARVEKYVHEQPLGD